MSNYDLLAKAVDILYVEECEDSHNKAWGYVHEADALTPKDDNTYNKLRHAVCVLITIEDTRRNMRK